jgi:hypothetical protein
MSSSYAALAIALAVTLSSARPLACQQARLLELGVQPSSGEKISEGSRAALSLSFKTVLSSTSGSLLGGAIGFMVDGVYCDRHHGDEPSFLFSPCFLYTGAATPAGWFGGAVVGSTMRAAQIAQKRGCPRNAALSRAMAGALVGIAPGVGIVLSRPDRYVAPKSTLIGVTPILAGIGAAAAVIGCHT